MKNKLKDMCNHADDDAVKKHINAVRDLASHVRAFIYNGKFLSKKMADDTELSSSLQEAIKYARAADSAIFVREKVLKTKGTIINIKFPPAKSHDRSFEEVEKYIQDVLATYDTPTTGFVYIAWREKAETFFYVGKSEGEIPHKRITNLKNHAPLTKSITNPKCATQLALVYLGGSMDNVNLLEGAIMELITFYSGKMPINNTNKALSPAGPFNDTLNNLADDFGNLKNNIKSYTDSGQKGSVV